MLKLALIALLMSPLVALSETKQVPITLQCNNDGAFLQSLRDEYQEKPILLGMGPEGIVMSLLANVSKGTWTIISIKDDVVCVLMAGEKLEVVPQPKRPPSV